MALIESSISLLVDTTWFNLSSAVENSLVNPVESDKNISTLTAVSPASGSIATVLRPRNLTFFSSAWSLNCISSNCPNILTLVAPPALPSLNPK